MRNHKNFCFGPWLNKFLVHTCAYQRLISSVTAEEPEHWMSWARPALWDHIRRYFGSLWVRETVRSLKLSFDWVTVICAARAAHCFRWFCLIWWTASSSSLQRTIHSRTGHQSGPFAWGSGLQVVIFSFLHRPIVLLHKTIRSNGN